MDAKENFIQDSSLWISNIEAGEISVIDQRLLPWEYKVEKISSCDAVIAAIKDMCVRGAPLIGIASAFGLWLGARAIVAGDDFQVKIREIAERILSARPTAVNPRYTLEACMHAASTCQSGYQAIEAILQTAIRLRTEDIQDCSLIGMHGAEIIKAMAEQKAGAVVNILTHCNAGWLACIKHGTALSPIYHAFREGVPLHVWVDETRPRNQGSRLTAWELQQAGIPHTIIPDNAGGYLMQQGKVDMVIVGADRIAMNGDTANKTGTYLKALAAKASKIPFFVAAPLNTFDQNLPSGPGYIQIEERDGEEVSTIEGWINGRIEKVQLCPTGSPVANYGFDITPATLISGFITPKGLVSRSEISSLFE